MLLKCLMWCEQGPVISPNHFLLRGRSQLNLHLYYPAHRHPPLPTASLATGCRHIYTSHASPATWRLYVCTCTLFPWHARRQMNSRKGRWWKYAAIWGGDTGLNKRIVLNAVTTPRAQIAPPIPSPVSETACSFLTVKPDFLYDWQLTDIINCIRSRLCRPPLLPTPWG